MRKATYIKTLSGWTGHAELFRLDVPFKYKDYDYDKHKDVRRQTSYVIVLATVTSGGPETYIFPATKSGGVRAFRELPGSYRGGLDIERALERAGYEVQR